ncbi:hypothetical protein H072_8352 [Dactylellina haptotyla CBS 200.50]|uniref:Uncharacterized protein n=1 Tax=Dactylellina haptotyla (strain CBS 200.50) TaxID=1284197 RepID=S8A540_DACHA|nr:hypothetical protein H072_8352 [Dactylellina haptotyla CBS 200.50]
MKAYQVPAGVPAEKEVAPRLSETHPKGNIPTTTETQWNLDRRPMFHESFLPGNQIVPNFNAGIETHFTRTQSLNIPRRAVYSEGQAVTPFQAHGAAEQSNIPSQNQMIRDSWYAPTALPPGTASLQTSFPTGPVNSNNAQEHMSPVHRDQDSDDYLFEKARLDFMVKRADELYAGEFWPKAEEYIKTIIETFDKDSRLRFVKIGGRGRGAFLMKLMETQVKQSQWSEGLATTLYFDTTDIEEVLTAYSVGAIEFWQSYLHFKLEDYDTARALCKKVVKLRAGDPNLWESHGDAIVLMNRILRAQGATVELEFFQSMLSQESTDTAVYNIIGNQDMVRADIYFGDFDIVRRASKYPINGIDRMAPFHHAVLRDNPDIVKLIGNVVGSVETPGGLNAFFIAISHSSSRMLQCLTEIGFYNPSGMGLPLHVACGPNVKDRLAKVNILVANSIGVNLKDNQGRTPLMALIADVVETESDMRATMEILLEQKPSTLQVIDPNGDTALHYAARVLSMSGIQRLLHYGASLTSRNSQGLKPRTVARRSGRDRSIINLLR